METKNETSDINSQHTKKLLDLALFLLHLILYEKKVLTSFWNN